jgi:hypothetical protein
MSTMSQGQRTGPRDRMVFGVVLLMVGVGGLLLQFLDTTPDVGGWIVALIGLGLLAAFAGTRRYGYLVPGAIMTGLGAGIVVSEAGTFTSDETGGVITLGLGLGFAAIWVIGGLVRVEQHHWWPLVPGAILAAVGSALIVGGDAIKLLDYWWVILIVLGAIVMWRAMIEGRPRE